MLTALKQTCSRCKTTNRGAALYCAYCGLVFPLASGPPIRRPNLARISPDTGWWSRTDTCSRRLSRLNVRGTPQLLGVCGPDLFMLVDSGGASRLYGFNLSGLREGRPPLLLGEAPAAADLIAPIIATKHGVYLVSADRVDFYRSHGTGTGFRPFSRQYWPSKGWRIAGATAAPDGALWLVAEHKGMGALYSGNGQSGEWKMRRLLVRWELSSQEAALLTMAGLEDGALAIAFAAGGSAGTYDAKTEKVIMSEVPGLEPLPATLEQRVALGGPAVAAPPESAGVPAGIVSQITVSLALLALERERARWTTALSSASGLKASGYTSDGNFVAIQTDAATVVGRNLSDRHRYRAGAAEFGPDEGATVTVGGAGLFTAVAVRGQANLAKLSLLVSGKNQELGLQTTRELSGSGINRTAILRGVPPISTTDAFYMAVLRDDEPELLFAEMMDPD